ncbi:MAG TPA: fatty acid desaturase [Candidatus Saccharimonadales bacterium]|nr:fatty acid desaturase [Candidatus Saccharimonadales bacterium]
MTIETPLETGIAFERLRLPKKFHQISPFITALYLAHALAFFLVPIFVAFAIVDFPMSISVRVGLALILGLIIGHGMHLLTFVGHEGMHTNLHRNKYLSAALALLWSSPVPLFTIVGYIVTHWKHHRFAGQNTDPDAEIFSQYKNFTSRFFLGRSKGVRIYMKNAVRLAMGLSLPENTKLPYSTREIRWLARINIALGLCALMVYALIWRYSLWLGFTVMLIPYFALYVFTCMRAYMEHAGTVPGRYTDSRSYTSPIYTALFFGGNYHLEHHLYPAVPSYQLPALHRYLASLGLLEKTGAPVDQSFFSALRYMTARFQYPCVDLQSATDEFLERIADGKFDREMVLVDNQAGDAMLAAQTRE